MKTIKLVIKLLLLSVRQYSYSLYINIRMLSAKRTWRPPIHEIPIIINNRDTISHLERLISFFEARGFFNLHIIDNNSTYPDLLKYYESLKYPLYRLDKNYGAYALWESGLFKLFENSYYAYTDSDVLPIDACGSDFMNYFKSLLDKYPFVLKAGFSLITDDIPDDYPFRDQVLAHEKTLYYRKIGNDFISTIDSTLALYKPFCRGGWNLKAIRTGYPYAARHLSWYYTPSTLTKDVRYYIEHIAVYTHWSSKMKEKVSPAVSGLFLSVNWLFQGYS